MNPSRQDLAGQYNRPGQNMSPAPLPRQNSTAQPNGYGSAHTPSLPQQRVPLPETSRYATSTSYTNNQNYKAPNPVEVYHLSDGANAHIPPDIRAQFQCDEQGRVLWFTAPPLNTVSVAEEEQRNTAGHSVKYLVAKARRDKLIAEKRKREVEAADEEEAERARGARSRKERDKRDWTEVQEKAMGMLEKSMFDNCEATYKHLYGDRWREELAKVIARVGG